MRALDPKCASSHSSVSKRVVAQLSAQSAACQASFFNNSCIWGLGNLVRCGLEAKISPDTKTGEESHAAPMIMVAVQHGNTNVLKALLLGGANKDLTDKHGSTALHHASQNGRIACVQILLDAGANSNAQNSLGITPLMAALAYKQVDVVRALLPVSDLSLTSRMGERALHVSVNTGSEECFELLLPRVTSDVDVRTVRGYWVRTTTRDPSQNPLLANFGVDSWA